MRRPHRRIHFEQLEDRRLLTTISDTLGFDIDADREIEADEPKLEGWTVYLDANDNSRKDGGEVATSTDANGKYALSGLPAGAHRVSVESRGWRRTLPENKAAQLTIVTVDEGKSGIDFAYKPFNSPPTEGNLLVTKGNFQETDLLLEYQPDGQLVQSWSIPGTENFSRLIAKDVEVDSDGRVQIFLGYDNVRLATLSADGTSFSTTNVANWDMGRTDSMWGDLAAFDDYLFANEHKDNSGQADGVLRFDLKNGGFDRFASATIGRPDDLTIGLDGFLYLTNGDTDSTQIKSFLPDTMTFVRQVDLPFAARSIAVNKAGHIYANTSTGLRHLDSNGKAINSTIDAGGNDIQLSVDGSQLIVSDGFHVDIVNAATLAKVHRIDLPRHLSGFGFSAHVQSPVATTELTAGLEHRWSFDEANGTMAADSVGANNVTLKNWSNGQDRWVPGIFGNGVRFSAAEQYIVTSQTIPTTDSFSISFWAAVEQRINNTHTVLVTPTSERWVINNRPGGAGIGIGAAHADTPALRVWENYVITVDRATNTVTTYRDGEKVAAETINLATPNDAWIFGHHQTVSNHSASFVGMMDEARVYRRVLSDVESTLLARRPDQPEVTPHEVTTAKSFGSTPTGGFDRKSLTVFLDPNRADWVAWNMYPDLRGMVPDRDGQVLLGAHTTGVDDQIELTVSDPNGNSQTVTLDVNGVLGAPSGNQAVIFGQSELATDAIRGDNLEATHIFDETGTHQSLFTIPGEYTFDFNFQNIGGLASYPDVWLLVHYGSHLEGSVYHDLNRDQQKGDSEPGLAEWEVYVDLNHNGSREDWEPLQQTDANGKYQFEGLREGNHIVRLIGQDDWQINVGAQNGATRIDSPATSLNLAAYRTPQPFTDGNILATNGSFTEADLLIEYRPDGVPIQAIPIAGTAGFSRLIAKDLTIDDDGNVQIFHGYDDVRLTTYDPSAVEFSETLVPDWDMSRTLNSFGDIAAFENFIFANDHQDNGAPVDGIIRFDVETDTWQRFDLGEVHDLTVGNDGNLYLVYPNGNATSIAVHNPKTMEKEREIALDVVVRSIAVDSFGEIYAAAASGMRHFDREGILVKSAAFGGSDVDISDNDQSLIVTTGQQVQLTSTAFAEPQSIPLPSPSSGFGFATFIRNPPSDRPNLTVTLDSSELDENGGIITGYVSRPTADGEARVTLSLSDDTQARLPVSQVTIPAGETQSPGFQIHARDDDRVEGDQLHSIRAVAASLDIGAARFTILDHEVLNFQIDATELSENGGTAKGQAQRTDTNGSLTIDLSVDDDSEASISTSVSFADGKATSGEFIITGIDDDLLDGNQIVNLKGVGAGYIDATASLTVTDHEVLGLAVESATISENSGSTMLKVTRSDASTELTVTLKSSDTSEATITSEVVLAIGVKETEVVVNAVDDATKDGRQAVNISGEAPGYEAAVIGVDVTDHESLVLVLDAAEIIELGRTRATVTKSNSDDVGELVVAILNGDASELLLPSSVTIPSNSASVTFEVVARFDGFADGDQDVKIEARATGIEDTSRIVKVLDNPRPYHNVFNPLNVDNDSNNLVSPSDVILVVNELNANGVRSLSSPSSLPTTYYDVNADQLLTPVDALLVINHLNAPAAGEGEQGHGLKKTSDVAAEFPNVSIDERDESIDAWQPNDVIIEEIAWKIAEYRSAAPRDRTDFLDPLE